MLNRHGLPIISRLVLHFISNIVQQYAIVQPHTTCTPVNQIEIYGIASWVPRIAIALEVTHDKCAWSIKWITSHLNDVYL